MVKCKVNGGEKISNQRMSDACGRQISAQMAKCIVFSSPVAFLKCQSLIGTMANCNEPVRQSPVTCITAVFFIYLTKDYFIVASSRSKCVKIYSYIYTKYTYVNYINFILFLLLFHSRDPLPLGRVV